MKTNTTHCTYFILCYNVFGFEERDLQKISVSVLHCVYHARVYISSDMNESGINVNDTCICQQHVISSLLVGI